MTSMTIQKASKILAVSILLAGSWLIAGCGDDDQTDGKPPNTSLNKIMALGASRVEGARPEFESFRYELWQQLVANEWDFDYIGTQTDEASYDDLNGEPFDRDHEGRGGWTSGEILAGLEGWLDAVGTPDIVLFSSPGGNDLLNGQASLEQVYSNINNIIDIFQERNPDVTILIEELAPGMTSIMTAELTSGFNAVKREVVTIAATQTTSTSRVLTVDMSSGFNDGLLADDVHYNEAGAQFIAARYYAVLADVMRAN